MKNLKSILFISLFLVSFLAKSEVIVYKTYEDYENGKGVYYEKLRNYMHLLKRVSLLLTKDGKKVKVNCKDIWGFYYKDVLFRVDEDFSPQRVIMNQRMVYYENGYAHLAILRKDKNSAKGYFGYRCYLSKDINTKMYPCSRKGLKKLKKIHPEFSKFYKCIRAARFETELRDCPEKYIKFSFLPK